MPFSEFRPSGDANAPFTEAMQMQNHFGSLMDRAQRRRVVEQDLKMQQEQHASNLASTSIQQDSARAQLAGNRLKLAEVERTTARSAALREKFNPSELATRAEEIRKMSDPQGQRRAASKLKSDYAQFHVDPELGRVIDEHIDGLEPVMAQTAKANLSSKAADGKVLATRADAAAFFPGYAVRVDVDPHSNQAVFVVEDTVDPQLNQRAVAALRLAQLKGDPAALDAVLERPEFQALIGVPGETVTQSYQAGMTAIIARQKAEVAAQAKAASTAQTTLNNQRKTSALAVPGYEGEAKTEVEAKEFRAEKSEVGGVVTGLNDVKALGAEYSGKSWASDPLEKNKLQLLAAQKVGMIVGALRIPITGPGAMTNEERKFIESLVGNPTKIFSIPSNQQALLDSMISKFEKHLDTKAAGIGLQGRSKTAPKGPVTGDDVAGSL
jgi:hypothetical protein